MRQYLSEMYGLFVLWLVFAVVHCTELTFELEDNAKQCFHDVIKKDTKGTLEFQVKRVRFFLSTSQTGLSVSIMFPRSFKALKLLVTTGLFRY